MLSRVAESVYWMSRYIERAESIARLIDVNLHLTLDMPGASAAHWQAVIATTGDYSRYQSAYVNVTPDNVIEFLVFDYDNPNSVYSCLRAARENARSIREIISSEAWEQINGFYLMVHDASREQSRLELPSEFFRSIRVHSHTIQGAIHSTMTHDEPWHFSRLGRLLERGEQTARLIDTKYFLLLPSPEYVGSTLDDVQWSAVLRSASGFEMYRKRYGRIDPPRIIEFLLLDRSFPRSSNYCIQKADESLHEITGTPAGRFANKAERELGRLRYDFAFLEADTIIGSGLHEFLDNLQTRFIGVGTAIFDTFFALRAHQSQMQQQGKQ
ncbi:MAG: alpha-E domain-containing protein [Spirochaetaceae bacterium]